MKADSRQLLLALFVLIFLVLVLGPVWFFEDADPFGVAGPAERQAAGDTGEAAGDVDKADSKGAESLPEQKPSPSEPGSGFGGYYQINATVTGGTKYGTRIKVDDLGNGQVRVSGKYSYVNFSFIGNPVGGVTPEGGTWSFSPSLSKLFQGTASISIAKRNGAYELTGSGSGTYFTLFSSGEGSGRAVGRRVAAGAAQPGSPSSLDSLNSAARFAAPKTGFPSPSPVSAGGAGAAAAVAAAASGIVTSRKRLRAGANDTNTTSGRTGRARESGATHESTEESGGGELACKRRSEPLSRGSWASSYLFFSLSICCRCALSCVPRCFRLARKQPSCS